VGVEARAGRRPDTTDDRLVWQRDTKRPTRSD
jgi:hypothetical protein